MDSTSAVCKIERPRVSWHKRDLDDSSEIVTASTILRDYANPDASPRVYQSWIPLWLLSERLWEEVEESHYPDWRFYGIDAIFPPLKVEIEEVVSESMSLLVTVRIRDGNHRTRYWKESGFLEAPAWVLDYRSLN